MENIVAFQDEFRQALPNVTGNVDYKIFRETLARITEPRWPPKIPHLWPLENPPPTAFA